MKLAHLHLPGITPFSDVSQLQQVLTTRLLAYKTATSIARSSLRATGRTPAIGATTTTNPASQAPALHIQAPDPTIITFTPNPVYTTGRRDLPPSKTWPQQPPPPSAPPSPSPTLSLPPSLEPIRSLLSPSHNGTPPRAEYHPTLRGGQTTYHGPGQMVAYTILDLRRLGLTSRSHIRLLENSVIDVLRSYGVQGFVTADPGVWVQPVHAGQGGGERGGARPGGSEPRKITAVGVHLRRHVSSYGIGFNVSEEPIWFFGQIVACGLEGREATSLEGMGVRDVGVHEVARRFVAAFAKRVNRGFACGARGCREGPAGEKIETVYEVREKDLLEGWSWS